MKNKIFLTYSWNDRWWNGFYVSWSQQILRFVFSQNGRWQASVTESSRIISLTISGKKTCSKVRRVCAVSSTDRQEEISGQVMHGRNFLPFNIILLIIGQTGAARLQGCNILMRGLWYSSCAKRINIVQYRVGIQNITDCWQIAYYGWSLSKIIVMKWLEQIWTWLVFRWRQLGHKFCCLGQGEIGSHTGWRRQHICTRRLMFILMLSFKIFNHWHWRTKSFQNGWHLWRYCFCFINNTTENRIVKILNF